MTNKSTSFSVFKARHWHRPKGARVIGTTQCRDATWIEYQVKGREMYIGHTGHCKIDRRRGDVFILTVAQAEQPGHYRSAVEAMAACGRLLDARKFTAPAVTAPAVTAQAVTAQAVTAQAVTAQAVTAQAVTAQAVTAQTDGGRRAPKITNVIPLFKTRRDS